MLLKSLKLISTHLKWVFSFLIYHPFHTLHSHYFHEFPLNITEEEEEGDEEVKIWHPHEEEVDCAVCLSKIGEGEEVRVLRCEHFFHRGCLDKWINLKNCTCPLCRDFLGPRRFGEGRVEMLSFKFCSFTSNSDEHENWWLR